MLPTSSNRASSLNECGSVYSTQATLSDLGFWHHEGEACCSPECQVVISDLEFWNHKTATYCSIDSQKEYDNMRRHLYFDISLQDKTFLTERKVEALRLENYVYDIRTIPAVDEHNWYKAKQFLKRRAGRSPAGTQLVNGSERLKEVVLEDSNLESPVVGKVKFRTQVNGLNSYYEIEALVVRMPEEFGIDGYLGADLPQITRYIGEIYSTEGVDD